MKLLSAPKLIFATLAFVILKANANPNPFLQYKNDSLSQLTTLHASQKVIVAPKGNNTENIPEFPSFTIMRLAVFNGNINFFSAQGRTEVARELADQRIPQIMNQLEKEGLLAESVKLARQFKIDPLFIIGPVVGEFVFNGYLDQALQNIKARNAFEKSQQNKTVHPDILAMSKRMSEIIDSDGARECLNSEIANYWKWRCVLFYSNKTGGRNSNRDLLNGFYGFNKDQNGHTASFGTFGIGQMQPFLMWSVNDLVSQKTSYKKFEVTDMKTPFEVIFDNKQMLAYIAAISANSAMIYKLIGGVDIQNNPGLAVTLYNVGDEYVRAYNFAQQRIQTSADIFPQVNYMGWFINANEAKLRTYLKKYSQ